MKNTLYKKRIELIVLTCLVVITCLISLYPVKNTLTAPGYNDNIEGFIIIEDAYQAQGSIHTTSVISLDRVSYLQKLIAQIESRVTLREQPTYYQNINISDLKVMGSLQKDDSLSNALVVAINQTTYNITYTSDHTVYLIYNYLDSDTLKIGDKVISINGNDPSEGYNDIACDTSATFEVIRDGEPLTFDITRHTITTDDSTYCAFGFALKPLTEIIETNLEYEFVDIGTTGSSGGLLQSLYIYNAITEQDITNGLKIAGTGTIDVDGNVGKIGGIKQKIITSAMNNIDIFFVPYLSDTETDNYIEAKNVLETLNTDMILVPVQTFQDALNYLQSQIGGDANE